MCDCILVVVLRRELVVKCIVWALHLVVVVVIVVVSLLLLLLLVCWFVVLCYLWCAFCWHDSWLVGYESVSEVVRT